MREEGIIKGWGFGVNRPEPIPKAAGRCGPGCLPARLAIFADRPQERTSTGFSGGSCQGRFLRGGFVSRRRLHQRQSAFKFSARKTTRSHSRSSKSAKSGLLNYLALRRSQRSERMEPTLYPAPKRRPPSGNGQGDDLNPVVLELDAHHDIMPAAFLCSTDRVVDVSRRTDRIV